MGLGIALFDEKGKTVLAMNWLRNPFGLCSWAEDNVHLTWGNPPRKKSLWYVCNHWAYDKSAKIKRKRFKQVVDFYGRILLDLDESNFFFGLAGYRQFIEPNINSMPGNQSIQSIKIIEGSRMVHDKLAIPVRHFQGARWGLSRGSHEAYQQWFRELMTFAELLQDRRLTFYCSN